MDEVVLNHQLGDITSIGAYTVAGTLYIDTVAEPGNFNVFYGQIVIPSGQNT